ncbi:DEAD/DEAH box helicase [Clostridia bacterium]|nr:DEAD/DEAH box helicase [Clostridia bacterium]
MRQTQIFQPHPYQEYAIDFVEKHPISALFLDCGLGKTVITLSAIWDLLFDSFEIRRVLIVAPLRVARNVWPNEIRKWEHLSGLTFSCAVGTEAQRRLALRQPVDIVMINRENVAWLVEESGIPLDFDMVVLDELSSFKRRGTERFKAMLKIRPRVKRIIGLTGTPAPNSLMDLWAEFRLLDMGVRLGRFIGRFRDEYFVPDKRNGQVIFTYKPRPGAEETIYQRIGDITISMRGSDHLRLPELVMNEIPVWLSAKEQSVLEGFRENLITTIKDEEITAVNAAVLANKLLQMANGAIYSDDKQTLLIHDQKLDALEDLIEAANGKPVLISYWFKHDLQRIRDRFPVETLDDDDSIQRWNAGDIPVAAIHPASAAHGLNLQAGGSTLIWFGLTWSLELYQQTNARLWRQGQKETVVIHHLVAQQTIDQDVLKALQRKDKTQSALIDAVRADLRGLNR